MRIGRWGADQFGLIYFNQIDDDKYEVLDGQQRITSNRALIYTWQTRTL